jgi:hypothetical protein
MRFVACFPGPVCGGGYQHTHTHTHIPTCIYSKCVYISVYILYLYISIHMNACECVRSRRRSRLLQPPGHSLIQNLKRKKLKFSGHQKKKTKNHVVLVTVSVGKKKSQKKVEWSYALRSTLLFWGFFFSKKTFFRIFRCAAEFGIVVTKNIGIRPVLKKFL